MTCPICRQPTAWEKNPWRPFCSERCLLTDLGTWAAEQYRIPGPTLALDSSDFSRDDSDRDETIQESGRDR